MGRKTNVTPRDFKKIIGGELRSYRKARGLQQRELAALISVDHSVISRYERGIDDISLYSFFQLCRALKIEPVNTLYDLETELLETLPDTPYDEEADEIAAAAQQQEKLK